MGDDPDRAPRPAPAWRWPDAAPVVALAAAAFTLALFFNFGYQSGGSFALAGLGVLALLAGMLVLQRGPVARSAPLAGALLAWLAVATALAVSDEPWSMFVRAPAHDAQAAWARVLFIVGLALVAAGAVRDSRWSSAARLAVWGLAFLLAADWTLGQTPTPGIDVWHMHQHAAGRLAGLDNPYTLRFANPYGGADVDFYGYPPVTLLLQLPFHAIWGDVRWASVAGIAAAAAAARVLARGAGLPRYGADAAAALLLVQGRPFYMIEQGWTEPIVAGLTGLAAVAWMRRSAWAAAAIAVALAAKQFFWLYVPLLALAPMPRRDLVKAALVLAVVFLPFFLWHPGAFWQGVVVSHFDGSAVNVAYPGVERGEPWPNSDTVAVHLQQYDLAWEWPLWAGIVLWVATGLAYAVARQRGVGVLLVTAAAGLACVGYFGTAFHPNYIWLVPVLALLGVLAHGARTAVPAPARPAATATGPKA